MSICIGCKHENLELDFRTCALFKSPIFGDCEYYEEKKMSALDTQVGGSHYKNFAIEPVEFCQKNNLNYCESNIIKYVVRHRYKNKSEDLEKARHYLDLLMEIEYEK